MKMKMKNTSLLPILMLMVVFCPLAIDIFLPALPIMAEDFSVPVRQMQLSITTFLLCMGVGQLIFGPIADAFGRRPVAIGGIIIYCISSVLAAFSEDFAFFSSVEAFKGLEHVLFPLWLLQVFVINTTPSKVV